MSHWTFIAGAYVLVYGVLLAYWRRVERGIRLLEAARAASGTRS